MYQANGIRVSDVLRIKGDTLKMEVDTICYQYHLVSELQADLAAQHNQDNKDSSTIEGLQSVLDNAPKMKRG